MNRHATIPLGRILGIPLDLDYSWFLIFGLLTWTLAVGYYPSEFPGWPAGEYWALGAVTAIMLFVSVLLHELGHSVVAIRYGVPSTDHALHLRWHFPNRRRAAQRRRRVLDRDCRSGRESGVGDLFGY